MVRQHLWEGGFSSVPACRKTVGKERMKGRDKIMLAGFCERPVMKKSRRTQRGEKESGGEDDKYYSV